jgi:large subunit ribosomal protein L47
MQAILDTLEERHKAWEKAHRLAVMDPDIDLTRTDGPQYLGDQNPYDIVSEQYNCTYLAFY